MDPHSIFRSTLKKIQARLDKAGRPRAFKDAKVANGLRGELFKLEGWAKIHRHWPVKKERKIFETIRFQAKELEDALGALDLAHELEADLASKGRPELAAKFDKKIDQARHSLKHVLHKQGWFEDRVTKMQHAIDEIDWPSTELQIDYLIEALVKDLVHLQTRYRDELKPKLVKTTYDQKIIEEDLHKFRRQLRWFSMYFATANGLIALGPIPHHLTAEKRKLVATYKDNPFAQLPEKKQTLLHIDAIAFYELTRLIEIIGAVKDRAERYFHTGAADLYGQVPVDTPMDMQKIMAEYERTKPLNYLAQSLTSEE